MLPRTTLSHGRHFGEIVTEIVFSLSPWALESAVRCLHTGGNSKHVEKEAGSEACLQDFSHPGTTAFRV
jgi:hypothetical protein